MDGYVSKPLQAEALYAAIEERAAPGTTPQSAPTAPEQPSPLDPQAIRAHFGDDEALLKEVASVFVETCPTWQAELRAALDAQDATKLWTLAHTVKGAVSHFGAQDAYDAAHQLELLGKSGQLKDANTACSTLHHALQSLQSALQAICKR
jgi:HPt (histidine-containing phosphotransfer) domain-containing protein